VEKSECKKLKMAPKPGKNIRKVILENEKSKVLEKRNTFEYQIREMIL
jgi:hypothetical protein